MDEDQFNQAVGNGDSETVRRGPMEGMDDNMTSSTFEWMSGTEAGNTSLHVACRKGNEKVAELLIKNQADLNVTNKDGDTALVIAYKEHHVSVVEMLIKNQADLNVSDRFGDTVLHLACRNGDVKVVELLIKNQADLNVTNVYPGDTPLTMACKQGHDKVVELLIKNNADLNMTDKDGDTALHIACRQRNFRVVELLVKNQADLNVTDRDGNTILHLAYRRRDIQVVQLLIKIGADLNVTDKDGDTVLHLACRDVNFVDLLIKNNADLNVTNKDGDTVLHLACRDANYLVVGLLIKNQADLNVTNKDGDTALHIAYKKHEFPIVVRLLMSKPDLKVTDRNGDTVLHLACRDGHKETVELLIKKQADLDVTNLAGDTALHVACRKRDYMVAELLVKSQSDLNVTDKDGDTALHKACIWGYDEIVDLLIRNRADLLVKNKVQQRPIDLVQHLERLSTRLLLEDETRKQAEYGELVSSLGSEEETTVRLFLCGDGQVGKTSLETILKKTGFMAALWNVRKKISRKEDIFNPTPGVHVTTTNVGGVGRLSLHDFAGQAQFYVTHAMLLRTTNAIFPVVYKITDGEEEQKRQVHGWLTFINCSNPDPTNKPRVVLIASHADKLQDKETGLRRAQAIVDHYGKLFEESLVVSNKVFLMNCLEAGSSDIRRLRHVFAAFRDEILKDRQPVPKVCVHMMSNLTRWRKERETFPVLQWEEHLAAVRQDTSNDLTERNVQLASSYLHDIGEIIYLHRTAASLVVLSPQWLFTSVFGHLLAPDDFPIDRIKRTALDHVTLDEITRVFGVVTDIPMLIKLLKDFQLCHTYDGYTFILPSLLQQEIDKTAWSHVSRKSVYFGTQICCRTKVDSFSCDLFPRLQTILMQASPDKLRRPLLWKNSAKCTDGKAEALLQITQDKRQLNIFVRSVHGNKEDCKSIMDLLADMAYKLVHETSPGTRSRDTVLSALDLREHRPQPHAYSREDVEEAATKGENVVHPQRNVPEQVTDLLLHLDHLEMDEKAWSPGSNKAVYFGIQIRCCPGAYTLSTDLFPRLQTLLMQVNLDKLSRPLLWPWKNSAKCNYGKAEALLQITQDKRQLNIFVRSNDGDREDCNSIMDLFTDMAYKVVHETSPAASNPQDMVLSALDLRDHRPHPHAYNRGEVEEAAAKGENVFHPQRKVPEKVKDLLLHPELLNMDDKVWSPVSSKAAYFGTQICCPTETDNLCDLFSKLQTRIMQAHPGKLCEPLLWKDSAKCTDGKAEALLQITQDKRQLNIFVRSVHGNKENCKSIMDLLTNMAHSLMDETNPGARSQDTVLSALDLREHRPQPHAYSREEVEEAAGKGDNVVHPQRNVPEKAQDLLFHLGSLKGMLGRVARKRPELVETLRHIQPILDQLRQDDVINMEEDDRIKAIRSTKGPQDAARELLNILEAKGDQACVGFHSSLKKADPIAANLLEESPMSEKGAEPIWV